MSERVLSLLECEQAIDRLQAEFPGVPERVILDVFRGYYRLFDSVAPAVHASRERIADACAIA
jgi:hypothetical protein